MTTRRISISEEAYQLLEKMRLPGERLDDTILRLCGVRPRGEDFKATSEVLRLRYLTFDEVLAIHDRMIGVFSGNHLLRGVSILLSQGQELC